MKLSGKNVSTGNMSPQLGIGRRKNTYYKKHKRPESLEGRQQQEKEHNRELTKSQMFSILPTIQIRQVKGVWVTQ